LEHPTYFIADIAANHDGDLEKAKDLIYSCAEKGANAAKFQNFQAETIVSDYGFKSLGGQQSHQANWKKSVFDVYKAASLPIEWTDTLKETCAKAGIDYFTSPYSLELVEYFAPHVAAWKLGSGDINWLDEIAAMAKTGKPLIMATGASTMEDVKRAYDTAAKYTDDLVLMQCNTNYTASLKESRTQALERLSHINLKVLEAYAREFPGVILGLSDHTHGSTTVVASVAMYNVRVIEKHYTLDNNAEGPDHPFSMNPQSWEEMVQKTRALEARLKPGMDFKERFALAEELGDDREELKAAIGDGIKKIEANEKETCVLQRRSYRATRDVRAGEPLNPKDFFPLRPCPTDALPLYRFGECVGKPIKRAIVKGDYLKTGDVL